MSASNPNLRSLRRRRPGGLTRNTSSSRRLSSIVNPDLLHDVVFHTADEQSRANDSGLTRRHSIAGGRGGLIQLSRLELLGAPKSAGKPRVRAVSERAGAISQSDAAALLAEWKESERKEQGMPQKLKTSLSDLPEDSQEDECEEDRVLLIEDDFADDEIVYDEKSTPSHWSVNVLVGALYLGYVFASFALQYLNQLLPGCAQLVSLLQYLSVVAENGSHAVQYFQSNIVPFKFHLFFVGMNFASVAAANRSLAVGLPFALFLVIKNTNLLWSLLLGMFVFGRSFTSVQIISIATITCGIIICVLAQNEQGAASDSATETVEMKDGASNIEESAADSASYMLGAGLAAFSTFAMALLGLVQENLFSNYHEADGECLFYTHFLGLPLFSLGDGLGSIKTDVMVLAQTPFLTIFLLVLNIFSTLCVKHSFVHLLEEGQALTATLTIALARMSGVLLSQLMAAGSTAIFSFWIGMVLVGSGSLSYATGGQIFSMCGMKR